MVAISPRVTCPRCRRPASVCYCAALPTLDTATRVVILQHPRERDMPIGTARMASLCLPRASLHVGAAWDDSAVLREALADPARTPILLYPGPGAKDILREPPRGPVTLVVVDGTWSQAKNVVRDNPILRALPRYAFEAPEPSEYRIRREPRDEYVSTIEALMHVLGALEGDAPRFRALLAPLRAMVDAQIAARQHGYKPRARFRRAARTPTTPRSRVPAEVFTRWDDLVVVVGEANAWPYVRGTPRGVGGLGGSGDEVVHWVAHRPATGDTFDLVVAPEGRLSPTTTFHVRIDEDRLRAGASRAALFERFAAWLRPDDVIASWGHYGPGLYVESGGALPAARIDLRAAAQRIVNGKLGMLETYGATFEAPTELPAVDGRAGVRLGLLLRILAGWRALP
jgi:DTW domain-containing protein YfiP